MKFRPGVLTLAVVLAFAGVASADETTFCNFFITTLPYTVSVQGHYCFDRNLSTAITTGNAITVNSDFVVVDLNNFKLGGGSAGLGTSTVGIRATNHRNITVRNGNIRGFKYGIQINGTPSGGHLVENNLLDGNTFHGADVFGDSVVIRNNIVTNTGGSTNSSTSYRYGISSYGLYSLVRDNVVINTFGDAAKATGIGYFTVSDHNLVKFGPGASAYMYGIYGGICRDDTVVGQSTPTSAFPNCTLAGHNVSVP